MYCPIVLFLLTSLIASNQLKSSHVFALASSSSNSNSNSNANMMRYATLSNGNKIPLLGLGTWKSEPGQVKDAVVEAIRAGYRHIDCAAAYGNEQEVGQALSECFAKGICTREDLFVTSKLWNAFHAPEDVAPSLKKTLEDLQLDYLDMYLMHWPVALKKEGTSFPAQPSDFLDIPIMDTWKAMEALCGNNKDDASFLTRGIGVSNFSVKKLKDLVRDATIPPAINQVERHPYLQLPKLLDYCKSQNIHVTSYSPLGSPDRPAAIVKEGLPTLLEDTTIADIAKRLGGTTSTSAQVLCAWAIKSGTSVIPKSVTASRIRSNLEAVALVDQLTSEDMELIASKDRHLRFVDGSFWCPEGGPITMENLWDEE